MKKTICVILLLVMLGIPSLTLAVTTIDSISFHDNLYDSAYDIRGVINGSTTISTTYDYDGYEVYFKVGDNEEYVYGYTSGDTITNNGLELKITGTPTGNNKSINVVYSLKNVSEEEKQYAIATTADVELANNDCAAIFKDEKAIVQITQDDEYYDTSYGTQVKISFSPVANTTWIGNYGDRDEYRYVNGEVTSYTYSDDEDTGLAFSWNGTLAAGEETSYSALFDIKEAEFGSVSFYKIGEEEPFITLNGLIGGSIITPAAPTELETGYKCYWNTKQDGTGTGYEAEKGIIIMSREMKLYEFNKSLWHDSIISPTDGMDVADNEEFGLLELLIEKEILNIEEKPEEDCTYIYDKNGKLLFKVDEEGVLTLAEGLTYEDNIEYVLTDEDKEMLAEEGFYIDKIVLIFGNPPEPVEYIILEGSGQQHEIEDGKDLVIKTNGDISKLKELRVDDEVLSKDNYTIKSGSTIATLKTAYLDTLSEGDHILTFIYEDGDVSTNFTIAKAKIEVEEEPEEVMGKKSNNPKTGDPIVVFVALLIVSTLGIIVTYKFTK